MRRGLAGRGRRGQGAGREPGVAGLQLPGRFSGAAGRAGSLAGSPSVMRRLSGASYLAYSCGDRYTLSVRSTRMSPSYGPASQYSGYAGLVEPGLHDASRGLPSEGLAVCARPGAPAWFRAGSGRHRPRARGIEA